MPTVLVTGASGFLGGAVVARLSRDGRGEVRAAYRTVCPVEAPGVTNIRVGDLHAGTEWRAAVAGTDCVVHTAARVHMTRESAADPLAEFRRVNVDGTLSLARQAVEAGARRFVFVSSVKVNGERTAPGRPFRADDSPAPLDPYGVSKAEAEAGLRGLASETGLEVVIVRPVLIYGPGVQANMRALLRWVDRGVPLPLGRAAGMRSFAARDNVTDLISTTVDHPNAAGGTFLVSDDADMATSELIRRLARALGKPARLIPVPAGLVITVARLCGAGGVASRLFGHLQVDVADTRSRLGWAPPLDPDTALAAMVSAYRAEGAGRAR